jgi:hypothetical protein
MITTTYRIRIEALSGSGEVLAAMEQSIAQDTLAKARPRLLIRFIEGVVRTFLQGHAAAEKKLAAGYKRKKARTKKLTLSTLLEHNHA